MPIYEYRCGACGHTLDALQKVSDAPLIDCPDCAAPALKRLISAPAFRLKGSGWYETDFKSDKDRRRNLHEPQGADKADKPKESGDGAKKEAAEKPKQEQKSDAKPATGTKKSSTGGKGTEAA